jgi:alpha/beta superfamily hydrolase
MTEAASTLPALDEQPFFFTRGDAQLFGMLHVPAGTVSRVGFVLSHPFAEEKLWSHRVYVTFARALAARGHAVLRFDYMGAGDSSGQTPDSSLETHLADLAAAVAELRARHPATQQIGLVGLRLGASFAAILAERAIADDSLAALRGAPLVLWDPVRDGEAYFQELLRTNLSTQLAVYGQIQETREVLQARIRAGGVVNVDGYEIGKALFESCALPALLGDGPRQHAGPVLVLQISPNEKVPDRNELRALAGSYPAGSFERAHEQPFWREIKPFYARAENLQRVTLEWLEKYRG